jgi:mannose-6-phosphate isomerase-like protein (cupin superfamily)
MKNPANAIAAASQSKGVAGYVYDGADGSQMAFWECSTDGKSLEHVHEYDEDFTVLQGTYTLIIDGKKIFVNRGDEYYIPKGVSHAGEFTAGTRTIHAFGGTRAKRG